MNELEELIVNAKNKDIKSFEKLIFNIKNDLYRIGKTKLDNDEDINDAVQETIIIAYRSIKKLKKSQFFKTWIIRILINECNKIHKKNKRYLKLFKKLEKTKDMSEITTLNITNTENKIELERIFEQMTYDEKLCITLLYNSNYKVNEIAKMLHISPNTVKSRITRAKNKIKEYYNGGVENETSKR